MNYPSIPLALLDRYQQEMIELNGFSDKTLQTCLSCLESFFDYARKQLKIDPLDYRRSVYELSEETLHSNRIDLSLFRSFLKEHRIEQIGGQAAIQFQYQLKKQRENSGRSLNRKLFTLRSYAKYLELKEVKDAHLLPFIHVPKVRSSYSTPAYFLTFSQLKQFFDAINRNSCIGIRNYAIYALMYGLGLRVGEVHRLRLDDLNLENSRLSVHGKGGRKRTLHLTEELKEILSEYLAIRASFYKSHQTNALFVSKKGNPIAIRTMEDNFKKLIEKTALNEQFKITCHTLRHTFATQLNEKEVDILVLQSLLGHSSPRSTQIYIHATQRKIREAFAFLFRKSRPYCV